MFYWVWPICQKILVNSQGALERDRLRLWPTIWRTKYRHFWSKIGNIFFIFFVKKNERFAKNSKFCQKSKILSKIEIFVIKRNFCQKSKFLSKIEIFVKNRNSLSKIEIFVKNRNSLSKIEILCQKSKFLSKKNVFSKYQILRNTTMKFSNLFYFKKSHMLIG